LTRLVKRVSRDFFIHLWLDLAVTLLLNQAHELLQPMVAFTLSSPLLSHWLSVPLPIDQL
jgi:hypothetical protein